MSHKKEIYTAVIALICAVAIGIVMQNSESATAHYGTRPAQMPATDVPDTNGTTPRNAMLDVQEITLTSAEMSPGITLPGTDSDVTTVSAPRSTLPEPVAPQASLTPGCEILATARPVAAAMVDLTMNAPCMPNERVTVHHNGMLFTETTASDGSLSLRVPALARDAVFIVAFANGDGAVAQTTVEELADYDRAAIQWKGNGGFQIHAREFGADYGSAGHIWDGAPGDLPAAVAGESGVLTRLGDPEAADPLLAEVYSFPKLSSTRSGTIALSVEAEVTTANCGLEVEAQALELQADGKIKTQNLTLAVPDCDSTGSFLVLNNLLQDLKVAGK